MEKRTPTHGQELFEKVEEEDVGIQSDESAGEGLVSDEETQNAQSNVSETQFQGQVLDETEQNVNFNRQPLFQNERTKDEVSHKYGYDDEDLLRYAQSLEDQIHVKKTVTQEETPSSYDDDIDFVAKAEETAEDTDLVEQLNLFGVPVEEIKGLEHERG